jgi:hypothetical protein
VSSETPSGARDRRSVRDLRHQNLLHQSRSPRCVLTDILRPSKGESSWRRRPGRGRWEPRRLGVQLAARPSALPDRSVPCRGWRSVDPTHFPLNVASMWRRPRRPAARRPVESQLRGRSSAGRALASQARCRGFEPRRPLSRKGLVIGFSLIRNEQRQGPEQQVWNGSGTVSPPRSKRQAALDCYRKGWPAFRSSCGTRPVTLRIEGGLAPRPPTVLPSHVVKAASGHVPTAILRPALERVIVTTGWGAESESRGASSFSRPAWPPHFCWRACGLTVDAGEVTPVTALDAPLFRRTGQRIRVYRATARTSPFAHKGRTFEVLVGTQRE